MKHLNSAIFAVALLALSGCTALQKVATVSDAQTAVGSAGVAISTIGDSNASVLTKAQVSACAAQDALNVLVDMLTSNGQTKGARLAADASKIMGYGCTWTLPAK